MKNLFLNSRAGIICSMLLLCLFAAPSLKAQIANPYQVVNSTNCAVRVDYLVKDPGCKNCAAGAMTIPANSSMPIPGMGGCATPCNVFIYVNMVGGAAVTVTGVDQFNTTNSGSCMAACNGGTFSVLWNLGGTTIY